MDSQDQKRFKDRLVMRKSLFHFLCYLENKDELVKMPEHFEKASDVLNKIRKQPLGYLYQDCFYSNK